MKSQQISSRNFIKPLSQVRFSIRQSPKKPYRQFMNVGEGLLIFEEGIVFSFTPRIQGIWQMLSNKEFVRIKWNG